MNKNERSRNINTFLVLHLTLFSVYNMGHPVTPQFINDISAPAYMTGVLLGVMALSQFFFAPFWGQVSDVIGRRIIFIGPLGYAIGQLGFILFSDPTMLLIFRFISGAFSIIGMTVHFAYISDHTSEKERTKYLGIASLLMPIGVFIGYTVGGFIGDLHGPRITFTYQAIFSLILSVVFFFYVVDAKKVEGRIRDIKWNVIKENRSVLKRNQDTILRYILVITFLNIISFQLTLSQAAVILNDGFSKSMTYIGLFVALLNLLAGVMSFFVQPRIFKHQRNNVSFLPYLSSFSVIAAMIAAFASLTNPIAMWLGLMLTTLLNTIFVAIVQDTITKIDKHNEKGALLGINQAVQSLGMFAGTTMAGFLLAKALFLPMFIGTLLFGVTALVNKYIIKTKASF